jgi:hypothetical protein
MDLNYHCVTSIKCTNGLLTFYLKDSSAAYMYVSKAHICKRFRSPGIDFEGSIPPAYVAWRTGSTNRVVELVVPARRAGNRFLGSLQGLQIRALQSYMVVCITKRTQINKLSGKVRQEGIIYKYKTGINPQRLQIQKNSDSKKLDNRSMSRPITRPLW